MSFSAENSDLFILYEFFCTYYVVSRGIRVYVSIIFSNIAFKRFSMISSPIKLMRLPLIKSSTEFLLRLRMFHFNIYKNYHVGYGFYNLQPVKIVNIVLYYRFFLFLLRSTDFLRYHIRRKLCGLFFLKYMEYPLIKFSTEFIVLLRKFLYLKTNHA